MTLPLNKFKFDETITSDNFYLSKHKLEKADEMFAAIDRDRKRLFEFLPWVPFIKTAEDQKKYIQLTHENWQKMASFDFSIYLKETDQFIGNIGVMRINWITGKVELGYWIIGPFEGKGLITKAVQTMENYLFQSGFNKIEIRCTKGNERSLVIPKRLGYKYEGTLRDDVFEHSQLKDTLVYSKLKKELSDC